MATKKQRAWFIDKLSKFSPEFEAQLTYAFD